eukprot:Amastigsp_a521799_8.p5 type:complete len:103 gc:universal Amastigsp_a521799_8:564-872(+)
MRRWTPRSTTFLCASIAWAPSTRAPRATSAKASPCRTATAMSRLARLPRTWRRTLTFLCRGGSATLTRCCTSGAGVPLRTATSCASARMSSAGPLQRATQRS